MRHDLSAESSRSSRDPLSRACFVPAIESPSLVCPVNSSSYIMVGFCWSETADTTIMMGCVCLQWWEPGPLGWIPLVLLSRYQNVKLKLKSFNNVLVLKSMGESFLCFCKYKCALSVLTTLEGVLVRQNT